MATTLTSVLTNVETQALLEIFKQIGVANRGVMSLILEQLKLTDDQLQELGAEFYTSLLDGTLTEARYDEIIELTAQYGINESFIEMIYQAPPAWCQKHYRRYGIQELG